MANLWSVFGKMPEEAIIDTIAQSLNTHPDQARNIYNAITINLQKQELLKNAIRKKYIITDKDQVNITKSEINQLKSPRKSSKLMKQVKIYYFKIDELRKNGISWSKIHDYLKQKYKVKISCRQLQNLYKDLQKIVEG